MMNKVTNPRTDEAIKVIFLQLMETLESREYGIRHSGDPEYLHEFRVAIRKTRTFLGQSDQVYPRTRLNRFKKDFAWLSSVTSRLRDIDVHILAFDGYKKKLSVAHREHLSPLLDYLYFLQGKERESLIKSLNTRRYKHLKEDWEKFIQSPCPIYPRYPQAGLSVNEFASEQIWKIYQKVIKQGEKIKPESRPGALHTLRKTCKKLRYMDEFFLPYYSNINMNKLIRSLKKLQKNLGQYHDLEIHKTSLLTILVGLQKKETLTKETIKAIHDLLIYLDDSQHKYRKDFKVEFRKFKSVEYQRMYKKLHEAGF